MGRPRRLDANRPFPRSHLPIANSRVGQIPDNDLYQPSGRTSPSRAAGRSRARQRPTRCVLKEQGMKGNSEVFAGGAPYCENPSASRPWLAATCEALPARKKLQLPIETAAAASQGRLALG